MSSELLRATTTTRPNGGFGEVPLGHMFSVPTVPCLRHRIGVQNPKLDASIQRAPRPFLVRGDGLGFPEAARHKPVRPDGEAVDQIGPHGLGPGLREALVKGVGADRVGVPPNFETKIRVALEHRPHGVEGADGAGLEGALAEGKVDLEAPEYPRIQQLPLHHLDAGLPHRVGTGADRVANRDGVADGRGDADGVGRNRIRRNETEPLGHPWRNLPLVPIREEISNERLQALLYTAQVGAGRPPSSRALFRERQPSRRGSLGPGWSGLSRTPAR